MEAVGGGAVAIGAASVTGAADEDDDNDEDSNDQGGMLVIIYDDSPSTDYTKAFPIHQEYDVPGCIAACPGLMEDHNEFLMPGQLEQIQDAGWEVMSHTVRHRLLAAVPVEEDVDESDTRIYAQTNSHGRFEGDPIEITGPDATATGVVAGDGEDDTGRYVELEEPIGESFEAGPNVTIRYTEEFTREILEESRSMLEEWGLDPVTGFIYTYDRQEYVEELVPDHYEAVGNAHGVASGLNPEWEPDPFDLHRTYFETDRMDEDELGAFLDEIANEPDFGILGGHTNFNTLPAERIEKTIEMALERDIEIVTLQEALVRLDALDEGVLADDNGDENGDDDGDGNGDDDGDDDQGSIGGNGENGDDQGGDDDHGENGDDEGSWLSRIIDRIMSALRSLFS